MNLLELPSPITYQQGRNILLRLEICAARAWAEMKAECALAKARGDHQGHLRLFAGPYGVVAWSSAYFTVHSRRG